MKGLTKKQKALRKKWIEALRSGEFRQIAGVLRDSSVGRCCLGVLDEVMCGKAARSDFALKESALDSVGLDGVDQFRLSSLNDEGVSFAEIAGLLEHLPAPEEKS